MTGWLGAISACPGMRPELCGAMKHVPPEAISDLHRRLSPLAPRSGERRCAISSTGW